MNTPCVCSAPTRAAEELRPHESVGLLALVQLPVAVQELLLALSGTRKSILVTMELLLIPAALLVLVVLTILIVLGARLVARWLEPDDDQRGY